MKMIHCNKKSNLSAFTLIELSMVLVIVALLIGALMVGRAMIRNAELQAIGTEFRKYSTAVYAFQEKYAGLPGDLKTANNYWPDQGTSCTGSSVSQAIVVGTCNGDGNGLISFLGLLNADGSRNPNGAGRSNEAWQGWNQLALAGFIEGSYSGIASSYTGSSNVTGAYGTGAPKSKYPGSGWALTGSNETSNASNYYFRISNINHLMFLNAMQVSNGGASLTTQDAWLVDTKLDDGMPHTGRVIGTMSVASCTNGTDGFDTTLEYDLNTTSANRCALIFRYLR